MMYSNERCEILEKELQSSKVKLEKECGKKYKELKPKLLYVKEIEKVLLFIDSSKY